MKLVQIGEVATQYGISNRSLRYWEETGILKSYRRDNGYRYFDEASIRRITQIIMLRKLRLSIQDIQAIFVSGDLTYIIEVLQRHLDTTQHEADELRTLGVILERLIASVKAQNIPSESLTFFDLPANSTTDEFENALKTILSERDSKMSDRSSCNPTGEIRIVNLPRMVLACYRAESETPEVDCAKVLNKLIVEHTLHEQYGFRHLGFNNPDPQEGNSVYGYEMWCVVPEDFQVPEPFIRMEFPGGLFASIPTSMSVIGERWSLLWDWVFHNEMYEVDWNPDAGRRMFEENVNYKFFPYEPEQLDLLAPIKLKNS